MEHNSRIRLFGNSRPFAYRPHHARFVVGVHQRYQQGVRPQRTDIVRGRYSSLAVHWQIRHLMPAPLHLFAHLQHRRMLYRARQNVLARRICRSHSKNGGVVALRCTGGKQHLRGVRCPQERGDRLARRFDRLRHAQGRLVHRTRIVKLRPEEWLHGLHHLGCHRRGRVIIRVDGLRCAHRRHSLRPGPRGCVYPPDPLASAPRSTAKYAPRPCNPRTPPAARNKLSTP